jgi:hypothetical protein
MVDEACGGVVDGPRRERHHTPGDRHGRKAVELIQAQMQGSREGFGGVGLVCQSVARRRGRRRRGRRRRGRRLRWCRRHGRRPTRHKRRRRRGWASASSGADGSRVHHVTVASRWGSSCTRDLRGLTGVSSASSASSLRSRLLAYLPRMGCFLFLASCGVPVSLLCAHRLVERVASTSTTSPRPQRCCSHLHRALPCSFFVPLCILASLLHC